MAKYFARASAVDAWRFERGAGIPLWVVRAWHDLGDGNLTHRGPDGLHVAKPGDWIVRAADGENVTMASVGPEFFAREFVPVPADVESPR